MKRCFIPLQSQPQGKDVSDEFIFREYVRTVLDSIVATSDSSTSKVVKGIIKVDSHPTFVLCGDEEVTEKIVKELNESNTTFNWVPLSEVLYEYLDRSVKSESEYYIEDDNEEGDEIIIHYDDTDN